jgi:hypothetical protein
MRHGDRVAFTITAAVVFFLMLALHSCTPSTSAPVQPIPPEAGDCGVAQALTQDRMIRLPDGDAAVVPCR